MEANGELIKIKIINGANLNMLGKREAIYGDFSYSDMLKELENYAESKNVLLDFFQSNYEGALIDEIHATRNSFKGLIINPGAFAHYSYAIADALNCTNAYKIEVHLSDIYNRESFRARTVTADCCDKIIAGKGIEGYKLAIDEIADLG